MNLVHIGLGKTATTTLQNHVFPYIKEFRSDVVFNQSDLMSLINKHIWLPLSAEEFERARQTLDGGVSLISREMLVDWNPRHWEKAADENLTLFGADTHILITVRDSETYLRSIYQQIVHQGNIIRAEDFFVSSSEYELLTNVMAKNPLFYFDVDCFDLEHLFNLYAERFNKVTIVPMEDIPELQFLQQHYGLTDNELTRLKNRFKNAPKKNVAYSDLAMKLTFKREWLLNKMGLQSLATDNRNLMPYLRDAHSDEPRVKSIIAFRNLSLRQKVIQFPFRVLKRARMMLAWRFLMQYVVSRSLPYRPYQLSDKCYRNRVLEEKNKAFIEKFKKDFRNE